MKIKNIFDIAGRAMAAQMVRLNTISSNLANAGATTGNPETVYKPLKPEFKTQYSESGILHYGTKFILLGNNNDQEDEDDTIENLEV